MKRNSLSSAFFYACFIVLLSNCTSIAQVANNDEKDYRPNFHFTPKEHWMNDPNGMFYADGKYHLFYQYYPGDSVWGPMHWGHAVSTDLVKWEELPIALYPGETDWIFSGSAVVDVNNSSGFGDGKTAPIVAIFTLHDFVAEKAGKNDYQTQGLAYSNDNGMTWTKYNGNPVLKNPGIRDFRDPKVMWDSEHRQWLMVLAAQGQAKFYRSDNLKDWTFLSDFGKDFGAHGGVWECPDIFPLKVEGSNETKWVQLQSLNPGGPNGGSGTQYFVGDFDGKTFTVDKAFAESVKQQNGVWLDYGKDNYAGVTWSNNKPGDNRKLFIGWMSNWEYATKVPTTKWRSSMTFPRELKLIKIGNDYRLQSLRAGELTNYHKSSKSESGATFVGKKVIGKDFDLTKAEITFDLKNTGLGKYSFTLSNEKGEQLVFGIDKKEKQLFVDRSKSGRVDFSDKFSPVTKSPLDKVSEKFNFKILLDKTSIEIFYNDGERVITEIFFPTAPYTKLTADFDLKASLQNLTLNQLKNSADK